jgi:hypothetical protein
VWLHQGRTKVALHSSVMGFMKWLTGDNGDSAARPNWTPGDEAALARALKDFDEACMDGHDDGIRHYGEQVRRLRAKRDGLPAPRERDTPTPTWTDLTDGHGGSPWD